MYYTLEKTAEILEMNTADVNRLREQGKLRAFRDGSTWKFRKEEVEAFLTKMIKERSGANTAFGDDNLLSTEDDEDSPTMLADSAAFDAMIDAAVIGPQPTTRAAGDADGGINLAKASDDDLKLADENNDDDLKLVEENNDDDLKLVEENNDDDLKLVEENNDDDLKLVEENNDDDLKLADENNDDDLKLADESNDDDFKLVDENNDDDLKVPGGINLDKGDSTPLTDSASALVEDESESKTPSSVDLASDSNSDDDMLHLDGDSGLSLLDDDFDLGGSKVSLGDEDDVVLGGSGSGSGLDLSGDSGLELLGDSDGDFQLSDSASEKIEEASKEREEDEDDSVFELADDSSSPASPVLNLDKDADSEAATELAPVDDSIFDLAPDPDSAKSDKSTSTSVSATQLIDVAENPFETKKEDSSSLADLFTTNDGDDSSTPDPFSQSATSAPADSADPFSQSATSVPADSTDPFGGLSDVGQADPFGSVPTDGGAPVFEKPQEFGNSFGGSDFGSSESGSSDLADQSIPSATPAPSTTYTGKDLIFLIPCLLLLIVATIGAWELCRTIWTYQEGVFDFGGPILETIAKLVKLI